MNALKLLPVVAAALLATACHDARDGFRVGYAQDAAHKSRPGADPFNAQLYQGYRELGDKEYYKGNYSSALIFYRKAIAAAQGQAVGPEEVGPWLPASGLRSRGLHGADLAAVQELRPRLLTWMTDARRINPPLAASHQTSFDCWIEELNEQDYDDALPCRQGITLVQLTQAQTVTPAPAAVPRRQPFLVFFDFDRSDITPEADRIIRAAADAVKAGATGTVVGVVGHADRSGTDAYNQRLSERRANAVRARLTQYGVPANQIRASGKGEAEPLVPTADGVREPQNRRVEIGIGP
jgi:OmpA-OmpF porin, OOP family